MRERIAIVATASIMILGTTTLAAFAQLQPNPGWMGAVQMYQSTGMSPSGAFPAGPPIGYYPPPQYQPQPQPQYQQPQYQPQAQSYQDQGNDPGDRIETINNTLNTADFEGQISPDDRQAMVEYYQFCDGCDFQRDWLTIHSIHEFRRLMRDVRHHREVERPRIEARKHDYQVHVQQQRTQPMGHQTPMMPNQAGQHQQVRVLPPGSPIPQNAQIVHPQVVRVQPGSQVQLPANTQMVHVPAPTVVARAPMPAPVYHPPAPAPVAHPAASCVRIGNICR